MEINKKKLIETVKPVSFRQIAPYEVRSTKSEVRSTTTTGKTERLIIETPKIEKSKVVEEVVRLDQQSTNNEQPITRPSTGKISALDKIRKQYTTNGSSANGNTNQPIH